MSQLKYAIVELIADNGKSNKIECGLLRGIGEVDGAKILWLVTGKNIVRGQSLKYYNVLSVTTFDGLTKTYCFFMADDDEQKDAIEEIVKAYENLKTIAAEEGTDLLDVSKFECVPDDFGKISSLPKKQTSTSSVGTNHITGAATHKPAVNNHLDRDYYSRNYAAGGTGYNDNWNADPTPFAWKRKGRKPTKKALELMRSKILELSAGKYEFKALPVKGEVERAKKTGRVATQMDPKDVDPFYEDDIPFYGCG